MRRFIISILCGALCGVAVTFLSAYDTSQSWDQDWYRRIGSARRHPDPMSSYRWMAAKPTVDKGRSLLYQLVLLEKGPTYVLLSMLLGPFCLYVWDRRKAAQAQSGNPDQLICFLKGVGGWLFWNGIVPAWAVVVCLFAYGWVTSGSLWSLTVAPMLVMGLSPINLAVSAVGRVAYWLFLKTSKDPALNIFSMHNSKLLLGGFATPFVSALIFVFITSYPTAHENLVGAVWKSVLFLAMPFAVSNLGLTALIIGRFSVFRNRPDRPRATASGDR